MPTTLQLVEQRNNVWEQMKGVMDSADAQGRSLTAEENETYLRLEKDFDAKDGEIQVRQRHEAKEDQAATVDRSDVVGSGVQDASGGVAALTADQIYAEAFQLFVQNGMAEMDAEQRKSLRTGFVKQDAKEIRAAAGIGTGSAGGYLVPQGFRADIIEKMKAYGAVQQVATVLNTSTGAVLPWPTNDDTGNVGALLAENTAAAEQDITLGTAQLGAYKYTSKLVRVSLEFLQDVDWLDAEGFLRRKFAERLGRIHNQHFTTGTGTAQPQGIVTGAVSGVTAAAVAAVTADELIDLQHSVDPAYRNERSKFMLSDTALKLVRKLKDSQNRYLFQPGGLFSTTSAGTPDLIAGSPYVVNQDMAVPATGVKSILFGDFEAGYVIRLVKAFELIRLEERYAEFGQVAFIAFDRADGLVQDNSAYKALTQA